LHFYSCFYYAQRLISSFSNLQKKTRGQARIPENEEELLKTAEYSRGLLLYNVVRAFS